MEIKKSKKAELESRKGTWFAMGLIVVLAFMFITFEWTEYDKKFEAAPLANDPTFELTMLPITYPEPPKPPPPAPAPVDVITIVDDLVDIPESRIESSDDMETPVEIKAYIPKIEEDKVVEPEFFVVVEKMPEFVGGRNALMEYLGKNIKYPPVCAESCIQGKVVVQFIVGKDGSISEVEVARGIHPYLDKEAVRVIQSMPKWKPGMQRNNPVRVKFTLPVHFRLQ